MQSNDVKENICLSEIQNSDSINVKLDKTDFSIKPEIKKEKIENAERDRENFYKSLKQFHENKGTPFAKLPSIAGIEIDLYKLYTIVTKKGGWFKVNYRNEWDDILPDFKIPVKCVNATVALKHLYIRYLDRYERVHYHKEDLERDNDDDDESRHKKWSARTLNVVPMSYMYSQHNVSELARVTHKLSTNLYRPSEYDKLFMSLLSPLPNEQDFAINVCTLMSNESKPTLKIEKCPKLIDALLAHAGIYYHYTTREIFVEFYSKTRKHSLQSFWNDCLIDKPEILELSYDDYFAADDESTKKKNEIISKIKQLHQCVTNDEKEVLESGVSNLDFLCLGRGLGTHDYIGQRVLQISSILRNLSFIDENLSILSKNRTFLRFLIICSNIRWANLQHMGLDMLGNVAGELELNDPSMDELTRFLLGTIAEGLESSDRAVVLSCLEILYKLCQNEHNEDYLHRTLKKKIYNQVCMFLSLSDIMLLLYALECIYALSSLGEKSCNIICQIHGAIHTLVSLVTVEAQSYGPDACILMRVVETVPGSVNLNNNQTIQQTTVTSINNIPTQQTVIDQKMSETINQVNSAQTNMPLQQNQSLIQQKSAVLSHNQQPQIQVQSTKINTPQTTNPQQQQQQQPISNIPVNQEKKEMLQNRTTQNTVIDKHSQHQMVQENEQFAMAWLRASFEPAPLSNRIEQQDFYTLYVNASSKMGRTGVVSPLHFPRCVRNVFGGTVGPNPIKSENNGVENVVYYYEGVTIRAKPLPIVHKGSVSVHMPQTPIKQVQVNEVSSINKQNEITNTIPVKLPPNLTINTQIPKQTGIQLPQSQQQHTTNQVIVKNVVTQQPVNSSVLQKVLTNNPINIENASITMSSVPVPKNQITQPATQSSLIKSLLANKVTTSTESVIQTKAVANCNVVSPCLISSNVNPHQVNQRQQLQKQKELAQQQITLNNQSNVNIRFAGAVHQIKSSNLLSSAVLQSADKCAEKTWDPVPPLAPLSGVGTTNIRHAQITLSQKSIDEDSNSTGNLSLTSSHVSTNPNDCDNSRTSFDDINSSEDDITSKDVSFHKTSHVVTANKMLADLLEKKSAEPPCFNSVSSESSLKRKLDSEYDKNLEMGQPENKKIYSNEDDIDSAVTVRPSAKAADLYAELAQSMLEDEDDIEEVTPTPQIKQTNQNIIHTQTPARVEVQTPTPTVITAVGNQLPATSQSQGNQNIQSPQVITVPLQRQIIVSPNNQHPMVFSPSGPHSFAGQVTQTTATIKTESGYQTVPVLLQHSPSPNQITANIQLPKQMPQGGPIIQPIIQNTNQTQYVLTTNQQGQTVVVAQNPQPQMHQTVLVTQTPQQQGTSAKTIIILQQAQPGGGTTIQQAPLMGALNSFVNSGSPQKVIMTTQQGQQVVVTQVPRPPQHQIIVGGSGNQQVVSQNQSLNISSLPQLLSQNPQLLLSQNQQQVVVQNQPQIMVQQNFNQNGNHSNSNTQQSNFITQQQIQDKKIESSQNEIKTVEIKLQNSQISLVPHDVHSHQSIHSQIQQQSQVNTSQQTHQSHQGNIITTHATTACTTAQQIINAQIQNQGNFIQHTIGQTQIKSIPIPSNTHSQNQQQQQHQQQQQQQQISYPNQQVQLTQNQSLPHHSVNQQNHKENEIHEQSSQVNTITPSVQLQHNRPSTPQINTTKTVEVPSAPKIDDFDNTWLWVCDWRGCPKKKFRSANEVYIHACVAHCPDNLDQNADIFCQWGPGPNLCDNLPRKRFSLMTHLFDRHCTVESFKAASQRRIEAGNQILPNTPTQPVTIIKQPSANPLPPEPPTTSVSGIATSSTAALHAIKRHSTDYGSSKELMDENEGPVTKSIRLTAALTLRNLVNYSTSAKRILRFYEPHLAGVALSNVESSRTIAQVLYEMNETHPSY